MNNEAVRYMESLRRRRAYLRNLRNQKVALTTMALVFILASVGLVAWSWPRAPDLKDQHRASEKTAPPLTDPPFSPFSELPPLDASIKFEVEPIE